MPRHKHGQMTATKHSNLKSDGKKIDPPKYGISLADQPVIQRIRDKQIPWHQRTWDMVFKEVFPEQERWRLFIDYNRQDKGPMAFDNDKEPGYLAAMNAAFEYMREDPYASASKEEYLEIHRLATHGVKNLERNSSSLSTRAANTRYGMKGKPSQTEHWMKWKGKAC